MHHHARSVFGIVFTCGATLLGATSCSEATDSDELQMRAFWRETIIDAAIYRAWVGSLGSLRSLPRLAHLICELAARLEIVGLLQDDSFEFPFRQQNLADACGLSTVHVNRTVQELKQQGLIEWEGRVIHLLKRRELEALAEFNPGYLHVGKYA